MIILYVVYMFVMLVWCNSLRIKAIQAYEEDKQENKFMAQMLICIALSLMDITEFLVVITVFSKIK